MQVLAQRNYLQRYRIELEKKLRMLNNAYALKDLKNPPSNQLERLGGDRKNEYSIRVNDQYRVCFKWDDLGIVYDVEIVDYHH